MKTENDTLIYNEFYELILYISERLNFDFDIIDNEVIFVEKVFDKNYNLENVEVVFTFYFDKKFYCYNFNSSYVKNCKVRDNIFSDYILDIYNIFNKNNLN